MYSALDLYFFLTVTTEKNKTVLLSKDDYHTLKPFLKRNIHCAFKQRSIQDYLMHSILICVEDGIVINGCGYEMIRRAKDDLLRFEIRLLDRATRQAEKRKTKKQWL